MELGKLGVTGVCIWRVGVGRNIFVFSKKSYCYKYLTDASYRDITT